MSSASGSQYSVAAPAPVDRSQFYSRLQRVDDAAMNNLVLCMVPSAWAHSWLRRTVPDGYLSWSRPPLLPNSSDLYVEQVRGAYTPGRCRINDEVSKALYDVDAAARAVAAARSRHTVSLTDIEVAVLVWMGASCVGLVAVAATEAATVEYYTTRLLSLSYFLGAAYLLYLQPRSRVLALATICALALLLCPWLPFSAVSLASVPLCAVLGAREMWLGVQATFEVHDTFARQCVKLLEEVTKVVKQPVDAYEAGRCHIEAPWRRGYKLPYARLKNDLVDPYVSGVAVHLNQLCINGIVDVRAFLEDPARGFQLPLEEALEKFGFTVNTDLAGASMSLVAPISPRTEAADTDFRCYVHPQSQYIWDAFWAVNALLRMRHHLRALVSS